MSGAHTAPWGGKSGESARQCTAQVIGGVTVAAWKSRTTQLQNVLDVGRGNASCQQSACDPKIHDAPVRFWEPLRNAPAPHPGLKISVACALDTRTVVGVS